jgi:hypothetical protein
MRETGLRLVARSRTEALTEQEMKYLGRLVSIEFPLEHVGFPHRLPTVAVDLVGYTGPIPPQVVAEVIRVIGDFELVALSPMD